MHSFYLNKNDFLPKKLLCKERIDSPLNPIGINGTFSVHKGRRTDKSAYLTRLCGTIGAEVASSGSRNRCGTRKGDAAGIPVRIIVLACSPFWGHWNSQSDGICSCLKAQLMKIQGNISFHCFIFLKRSGVSADTSETLEKYIERGARQEDVSNGVGPQYLGIQLLYSWTRFFTNSVLFCLFILCVTELRLPKEGTIWFKTHELAISTTRE